MSGLVAMSRIGRAPIEIPEQVEIKIQPIGASNTIAFNVAVKGPKGELNLDLPETITVREEGNTIIVERSNDEKESRSLHGLSRTLINNMVLGVVEGYSKDLEIVGVGYRAEAKGDNKLVFQLGFSHPVELEAPAGVSFKVEDSTSITVSGIDKQAVGETAARIRALKKPEPYKGKGIRYKGEHIIRKAVK